jgi:hypothetical protein
VLTNLPGAARNKGSATVKEILPVLKIEHGVMAIGVLFITGRKIENQIARIWQICAFELPVQTQARMLGSVWIGRGDENGIRWGAV